MEQMMKRHNTPSRHPELGPYDVLVCGGGPGGYPAALAAARQGLKVLLIESKHALGGTGTTGLVSHWLGGRSDQGQWVIGGIFREMSEKAARHGIAVIPDPAVWADSTYAPYGIYKGQLLAGIPFEPLGMATLIERTLLDAGVEILFETAAVDLILDGRQVNRVIVASKAGLTAVHTKTVIDATGDADIAAFAGCRYEKGDEEGYLTGVSLIMHLDGVDEGALMDYVTREDDPRFRKLMADLRAKDVDCLNYQIIIFVKLNEDGYFMINGRSLEDVDGTDPFSRSRAYIAEREKIPRVMELFRRHFPGCADIKLRAVASNLGVRETRRIQGMGYMSVQDVINSTPYPDIIGFSAYGWDLGKRGVQPMHGVKKPAITPIPYGVMVPEGLNNVICPGRAVHVERPVLGPLRVQAPIMAMGEAAGMAAMQVVHSQRSFAQVDIPALRHSLHEAGAIVNGLLVVNPPPPDSTPPMRRPS